MRRFTKNRSERKVLTMIIVGQANFKPIVILPVDMEFEKQILILVDTSEPDHQVIFKKGIENYEEVVNILERFIDHLKQLTEPKGGVQ